MTPFEGLLFPDTKPETNFKTFQDIFIGPLRLIISILKDTLLYKMDYLDFMIIMLSLGYTIIEIYILFFISQKIFKLIKNEKNK